MREVPLPRQHVEDGGPQRKDVQRLAVQGDRLLAPELQKPVLRLGFGACCDRHSRSIVERRNAMEMMLERCHS